MTRLFRYRAMFASRPCIREDKTTLQTFEDGKGQHLNPSKAAVKRGTSSMETKFTNA